MYHSGLNVDSREAVPVPGGGGWEKTIIHALYLALGFAMNPELR